MSEVDRDALSSYLGEGFHTGLRKAADSNASQRAYAALDGMPIDEWTRVCRFVADAVADALEDGDLQRKQPGELT